MIEGITLYDSNTGALLGTVTGTLEDLAPYLNFPHIKGIYDINTQYWDLVAHQIKDKPATFVSKPLLHELRNKRDELLENFRWTVMPDSPLSESNKVAWLAWLKSLQSLLLGVTEENTDTVIWPEKPPYEYA